MRCNYCKHIIKDDDYIFNYDTKKYYCSKPCEDKDAQEFESSNPNKWWDFKPGDKVDVVNRGAPYEQDFIGVRGTFLKYSKPHGYALVKPDPEFIFKYPLPNGYLVIDPENLLKVPD